MKLDTFVKEHKKSLILILVLVLVLILVSSIHEFKERREGYFNKYSRNNYESRFGGENQRFGKNGREENQDSRENFKQLRGNEQEFQGREPVGYGANGPRNINRIMLPLNIVSEADASKTALSTNTGAKIVGASIENTNGTIAYTFVLDNKNIVSIDAVKGTIITGNKEASNSGITNTGNISK